MLLYCYNAIFPSVLSHVPKSPTPIGVCPDYTAEAGWGPAHVLCPSSWPEGQYHLLLLTKPSPVIPELYGTGEPAPLPQGGACGAPTLMDESASDPELPPSTPVALDHGCWLYLSSGNPGERARADCTVESWPLKMERSTGDWTQCSCVLDVCCTTKFHCPGLF